MAPVNTFALPFSFTYTPANKDFGKNVTITVTTNNPLGGVCKAAKATYTLTVNSGLAAPIIGTITQPTCLVSTGNVLLSGLPATGEWIITHLPEDVKISSTGTSFTVAGLQK